MTHSSISYHPKSQPPINAVIFNLDINILLWLLILYHYFNEDGTSLSIFIVSISFTEIIFVLPPSSQLVFPPLTLCLYTQYQNSNLRTNDLLLILLLILLHLGAIQHHYRSYPKKYQWKFPYTCALPQPFPKTT